MQQPKSSSATFSRTFALQGAAPGLPGLTFTLSSQQDISDEEWRGALRAEGLLEAYFNAVGQIEDAPETLRVRKRTRDKNVVKTPPAVRMYQSKNLRGLIVRTGE